MATLAPLRLQRELQVRGLTWSSLLEVVSSATVTQLRAGRPVSIGVAVKVGSFLRHKPVDPLLASLLEEAS